MGTPGVLAKLDYIQSLGGDQKIAHMVTFVSQQHGLPIAPLVYGIVGWPALRDLTPGSKFMHAVNDAPLPTNVKFTSIYTCTDEYPRRDQHRLVPRLHGPLPDDVRPRHLPRHARRAHRVT